MKYKIIVITGPTASGKTKLALKLAKKITPASIISIDSRQAYQNLPIITGQDIPKNFLKKNSAKLKIPYYTNGKTRLWAVNTIPLDQDINIADFTDLVFQIIRSEATTRNIILVGGSGLYLKAITTPIPTINIPPNPKLRTTLNNKTIRQLQKTLKDLSPKKFNQLNNSDKNNPHRLIRAIEIIKTKKPTKPWYLTLQKQSKFLILGIKNSKSVSATSIKKRVTKRINQGAVKELQKILKTKKLSPTVTKILGTKQIIDYLNKKITKTELIDLWAQAEYSYHKRQLTWFARQSKIIWYDKDSKDKLTDQAILWLKQTNSP